KNVMAIATGLSDGLEYGLNARAALVTRGLAEISAELLKQYGAGTSPSSPPARIRAGYRAARPFKY
ncbi:hypothetical protein E2R49_24655, partial [Salmonella enterica subsp. enterica serovar Minnesota]|nr:hypothetical protein [Salmonella enterica subsp. enterica serovar Minnesota]